VRGSYDSIVFRAERNGCKEVTTLKKTYLITGIEPGLMKDFKTACSHYELSMRDVFIKHMQNIVSDFDFAKWAKDETKKKQWKVGKQL